MPRWTRADVERAAERKVATFDIPETDEPMRWMRDVRRSGKAACIAGAHALSFEDIKSYGVRRRNGRWIGYCCCDDPFHQLVQIVWDLGVDAVLREVK